MFAGKYIGEGLKSNDSLMTLDLSWNKLRRQSSVHLAESLKVSMYTDMTSFKRNFSQDYLMTSSHLRIVLFK